MKLRTEWRQSLNTCKDNYKKAVYAAFLGYDCHEINTNIEDWLWARLFNCKMNQFERTKSFRQLQLTVCVECGIFYADFIIQLVMNNELRRKILCARWW